MPNSEPNNPAGRLLMLVRRMQDARQFQLPAKKVWANILEIKEDTGVVLRGLADILGLLDDVVAVAEREELSGQAHIKRVADKFRAPFETAAMATTFQHYVGGISEAALPVLETADETLSKLHLEPTLPPDRLNEIKASVHSLIKEVSGAELEADFRDFLLRQLGTIDRAISDYRIKGYYRVEEGVQGAIAAALFETEHHHAMKSNPYGVKTMAIIATMATLLAGADAACQLPGHIQHLLPAPDAHAIVVGIKETTYTDQPAWKPTDANISPPFIDATSVEVVIQKE